MAVALALAAGTLAVGAQSARASNPASALSVGAISEYTIPTAGSVPEEIAAGPDGNLWFNEGGASKIGKITTGGTFTEYPLPTSTSGPPGDAIAAGPDGNIWFTEYWGNKIGKITTGGSITEYPVPTSSGNPTGIAAGPDGNLWFTEYFGNNIGKITTGGTFTEYTVPTSSSNPAGIAAGPDGNIWFTEVIGNNIGKITTGGAVTEYPVPTSSSAPAGIAAGPDGNLWFTEESGDKIGKITTGGAIAEYQVPTSSSNPAGIAAGPDGNLWFTEPSGDKIGKITTGGTITEYPVPTSSSTPAGIAAGPDGSLWFTEQTGNKIGKVVAGPPAVCPVALLPDGHPKYVVLLAAGVASSVDGGPYDPLALGNQYGYCSDLSKLPAKFAPVISMNKDWDNAYNGARPPNTPALTTVLGQLGAVVLPFSYHGAQMDATGTYTVNKYDSGVPGNTWPEEGALTMDQTLNSIHSHWRNSRIVVVGHSEGGLVAQLWWQQHGRLDYANQHDGVAGEFSLDSPISGLQDAGICLNPAGAAPCLLAALGPVGPATLVYFASTWDNRQQVDLAIQNDEDGSYIPIGSRSDPLYSDADYPFDGLFSQLEFADGCSTLFGPSQCNLQGLDALSYCDTSLGPFPVGGHSVVKDCLDPETYIACLMTGQTYRYNCNIQLAGSGIIGRSLRSAGSVSRATATKAAVTPVGGAYGALTSPVLLSGGTVTVNGAGFGASPGVLEFSAAGSFASAPLTSWSDTQVVGTVPAAALTGPVRIHPQGDLPLVVGLPTILPSASDGVASLAATQVGSSPIKGQPSTVQVHALDSNNAPVASVPVGLSDGKSVLSATTDQTGTATFTITGYRQRTIVAYSGIAWTQLTVTFVDPPKETLALVSSTTTPAVGSGLSLRATLTNAQTGAALPGQTVNFTTDNPSATLSAPQAITGSDGVASVNITSVPAMPFVASVDANYMTAHASVPIYPPPTCPPPALAPAAVAASSTNQYTLSNSDGSTWQEIDATNLSVACIPSASESVLLTVNADLWTANAGYNQDLGIFVSDNGGADMLVAWKESGGFAGTFSPNAAYLQTLYNTVSGHSYVFKLKWKTNKPASGATIFVGAGASPIFSPTSLVAETFPTGVGPNFAHSTMQYTLANSDGITWHTIDATNLSTTLSPGANATAVLGANADLWTANAGYNQDLGIFVSDNGGGDQRVGWKESGGFAGTFSPNAAFVKATYAMTGGHTYSFKLKWKTNKPASGATIFVGAGPIGGNFSPTTLFAQTIAAGANPYAAVSTSQYSLSNSDGVTWQPIDAALNVTVTPGADTNSILGANADLWTANAGYNQDIGIFVGDNGSPDTLVAWKESGGFAGTFSPNAAFAQATYQMTSGHTYVFKLKWKTNKPAQGATIFAAAGGPAPFSPTRLTVELTH